MPPTILKIKTATAQHISVPPPQHARLPPSPQQIWFPWQWGHPHLLFGSTSPTSNVQIQAALLKLTARGLEGCKHSLLSRMWITDNPPGARTNKQTQEMPTMCHGVTSSRNHGKAWAAKHSRDRLQWFKIFLLSWGRPVDGQNTKRAQTNHVIQV